jgi:hypothetical protein
MPFAGTVTRKVVYHRSLSGELSFAGALGSLFKRKLSGVLSFAGDLSAFTAKQSVSGILGALTGLLTAKLNGVPVGVGNIFSNSKRFFRRLILQWRQ